ncbi:MAG: T9SS type A sorting domain-containing protein [Flavobacteriales bacterium]
MKKNYLILILISFFALLKLNAQVIDTLNTRAEFQQWPTHEPGFDIDQNNGTLYYGGTTGLYYSTDNGDTWTYNAFTVSGNERAIHSIEVDPNTGRVYAASTNGGIAYTDDLGVSWTILNTSGARILHIDENSVCYGLVGALFRWTVGDWGNRVNLGIQADKVTSGDDGYLYGVSESQDKIYYSADDGVTWEVGVDADAEAKFIIPKANNEVIYSIWGEGLFTESQDFSGDPASIGGTFLDGIKLENGFMWLISSSTTWMFSSDNGENFDSYYTGLTTELLNGVEPPSIDADGIKDQLETYNGKIYLAETRGRIYTVESGIVSTNELEEQHSDVTFYPNPVSVGNQIVIETESVPEQINIYTLSGKLLESNSNTKIISSANLSAGTYILNIRLGETTLNSKLFIR